MPKLYSYVVARDYGFAPNPFYGFCTLATCRPEIRRMANVGDWILGTGSKGKERDGHVVYAMRVTETMTFNEYWQDPRSYEKRPDLHASIRKAFGDNIYHRNATTGKWHQEDSHHSCDDGTPNSRNVARDTRVNRVLVSDDFYYWGGHGPEIPITFRKDVCKRGSRHKHNLSVEIVAKCIMWLRSFERGYRGDPLEWDKKSMGLPWDKRRRTRPFQPHSATAVRAAIDGLKGVPAVTQPRRAVGTADDRRRAAVLMALIARSPWKWPALASVLRRKADSASGGANWEVP